MKIFRNMKSEPAPTLYKAKGWDKKIYDSLFGPGMHFDVLKQKYSKRIEEEQAFRWAFILTDYFWKAAPFGVSEEGYRGELQLHLNESEFIKVKVIVGFTDWISEYGSKVEWKAAANLSVDSDGPCIGISINVDYFKKADELRRSLVLAKTLGYPGVQLSCRIHMSHIAGLTYEEAWDGWLVSNYDMTENKKPAPTGIRTMKIENFEFSVGM